MPDELPTGGISAWFRLVLDKMSLAKVRDDIRTGMAGAGKDAGSGVAAGLKAAGEKGGKDAVEGLRRAFDLKKADIRESLFRGLIDPRTAEKQSRAAAQAFNRGILNEIQRLGESGKLTDQRFIELTGTLKDVGETGARSFYTLRSAIANATVAGGMIVLGLAAWRTMISLVERAVTAFRTWGEEISRAQGLQASFDTLAARIGTTADELLPRLRQAVHYTVQDQDLFALANQAVQLGVVKNAKEMETFARVARILGRAMGGEAVRSVEDMAIALGRQSTRVLDNLGIILKQAEAERIYAAQIGKTADQLTDEEKRLAFVTVALQRASQASAGLSKEQITSGERMQQLAAAWDTLWTRMKVAIAESPQVKSFFESIGIWAENSSNKIDNFADHFGALVDTILGSPVGRVLGGVLGAEIRSTVAEGASIGGRLLGVGSADYQRNLERRRLEREVAQLEARIAALKGQQGKGAANPDAQRIANLTTEIAKLKEAADLHELTARQLTRAAEIERVLRADVHRGTLDEETRKKAIEGITTLQSIRLDQAKQATQAEREHQATLDKQAEALGKLAKYGILTEQQRQIANALEREYRSELNQGNLSLEQRERLMKRIADLQPATLGFGDLETAAQRVRAKGVQRTMTIPAKPVTSSLIDEAERQQTALRVLFEYYRDQSRETESIAISAAQNTMEAWGEAFALMITDGANMGKTLGAVFKGMGRSAAGALAEYAGVRIAKEISEYVSDMAMAASMSASTLAGNLMGPVAAAGYVSAAHAHLAAIPKWVALGALGVAGGVALSGGGGGGGGGFPSSSGAIGGSEARQAAGPEVHIHLEGDFDALSPRVQKVVYKANQYAQQRYGDNANIILEPGRRS